MTTRRSFLSGVAGLLTTSALPRVPEVAAVRRFVSKPMVLKEGDLLVAVWRRDGASFIGADGWVPYPVRREDAGKAISVTVYRA